ncbi:MAG: (2Fe-2S) ferredoxin domain-containing protein [Eubacteriales bacterium]|nr:(2Fe-2S) ferredoxin domain-containing protein [Eubacteriales bacterium]
MKIEICIGSSCHLRGSHEVIEKMTLLLKQYKVNAEIELCGSFCMDACSKGVSVRVDGEKVYHLKPDETEAFFQEEVLRRIQ